MPDSIRQILTDTRALLRFLQESGLEHLPRSPELEKFLAQPPAVTTATVKPQPPPRPAKPVPQSTSPRLAPATAPPGAQSLLELGQELAACQLCPLHQGRLRIVPGSGTGRSGLLIIEDQPGEAEEAGGAPFGGEAGELLDKMLKATNLLREEVYLTSLVKCRPPADRDPVRIEISACQNYLARQIAALNPAVICVMGPLAAHVLTGSDLPLFRLRGKFHDFHGTPLLVSFHPRFLLRNPEMKKGSWQDLQTLQKKLLVSSR